MARGGSIDVIPFILSLETVIERQSVIVGVIRVGGVESLGLVVADDGATKMNRGRGIGGAHKAGEDRVAGSTPQNADVGGWREGVVAWNLPWFQTKITWLRRKLVE